MRNPKLVIGLSAVILAVDDEGPSVLTTLRSTPELSISSLPFGPFDPSSGARGHRTFELALRDFVTVQTGFAVGYVEQLYTFGDHGREAPLADMGVLADPREERVVSVGYLALTSARVALASGVAAWRDWYVYFPWEDRRSGRPAALDHLIAPQLEAWTCRASSLSERAARRNRVRIAFGLDGAPWNEERVLERYELLYEAGLAPEASRDRGRIAGTRAEEISSAPMADGLGEPMLSDHRRILATAIGRLRAKIKYRPVVFELMPERFSLLGLQRVVEAISGTPLHKSNFRRLLLQTGLVEGTKVIVASTGGRPAELFRFRREALVERSVGGVNIPTPR